MVFRAYQRALEFGTHWVQELYGQPPRCITAAIAEISTELMIEKQRQIKLLDAKAAKKELVGGAREGLEESDERLPWLRNYFGKAKRKWLEVRM